MVQKRKMFVVEVDFKGFLGHLTHRVSSTEAGPPRSLVNKTNIKTNATNPQVLCSPHRQSVSHTNVYFLILFTLLLEDIQDIEFPELIKMPSAVMLAFYC